MDARALRQAGVLRLDEYVKRKRSQVSALIDKIGGLIGNMPGQQQTSLTMAGSLCYTYLHHQASEACYTTAGRAVGEKSSCWQDPPWR